MSAAANKERLLWSVIAATTLSAAAAGVLYPPFGLDLTAVDPNTRPGDDFFQYANGAWLARTSIPADKPFWTEAQAMRNRIELQLRGLIESAAAQSGRSWSQSPRSAG